MLNFEVKLAKGDLIVFALGNPVGLLALYLILRLLYEYYSKAKLGKRYLKYRNNGYSIVGLD